MNISLSQKLSKKSKYIFLPLMGMTLVYFVVTEAADKKFEKIEFQTREQIVEQKALLTLIAEVTSRNGADSVTELIVRDCTLSERSNFDDLLGRLNNGLSYSQLTELERLFGRCGAFFSDRKSVMVSRLIREIEIYGDYVKQLNLVLDKDLNEEFSVELWNKLAKEEGKQSESFLKLVALQDKIIKTLLSGKSVNSEEIKNILNEVNEVQQSLVLAKLQATELRETLTSL